MALTIKMAYFFLERAAEPISERLENAAMRSPTFKRLCAGFAKGLQTFEHNKTLRRYAREQKMAELHGVHADPGRAQSIPADMLEPPEELSEEQAVKQGAEMLGEMFVVGVGLTLLIHQQIQDRAEEAENEAKVQENEDKIKKLLDANDALQGRVDMLEAAEARRVAAAAAAPRPSSLRTLFLGAAQ